MMDEESREARIKRAEELLAGARHAAIATVNADGSPHNTPVFFMFDDSLEHFYWGSHPDSSHSQNVAREGKIFVALYDAVERGGLFVEADNAHATAGEELIHALDVHNGRRARDGAAPLELDYYQSGPQNMYMATARKFWVNSAIRDKDGHVQQDIRIEVSREELLR